MHQAGQPASLPARAEFDTARVADDSAEAIEEAAELAEPRRPSALRPDRFFDRELSWLSFNARVLELAEEESIPLLERTRFAAIFASNLDEFFMVQVAGIRRRIATGITVAAPSGLTPAEQLRLVSARAKELALEHAKTFRERLRPALQREGIVILSWSDLTAEEQEPFGTFFDEQVYPVLTPLAVDPAHPFPYISGLSLNLAVVARDPEDGREVFARVKVPQSLPRFLPLPGDRRFLLLEDLIRVHLGALFPGVEVVGSTVFRVTRNEDLEVEEEDVDNLLLALERELARRRFGAPVRLEIEEAASEQVEDLLVRELGVDDLAVYRLPGPLNLADLDTVADLDEPRLKYPPFVPVTPASLQNLDGEDIFSSLRRRDVLVHHPYDSFSTTVQEMIEEAANDPRVLAIKQTLYRTSGDSPIVDALIEAAQEGKQVLVIVEIKARFDEQANIRWARKLEQAGCHVVYGLVGLKTHCKVALVVRQDPDGRLRRYAHVGTGNYNPRTASLYEDIGVLTADPDVGADVADLFNHLSGHTRQKTYRRLLVAPGTARSGLLRRIRAETAEGLAGRPAAIFMKLNSLTDEEIIDALYEASLAGVPVELVVRSRCALRPGVPGLSDNIRVRSIVGRFLEHSRIFRFHARGSDELWIGSADMMRRNLDRRVEALVDVDEADAHQYLTEVIELATSPSISAWHLQPDGSWRRAAGPEYLDYHEELLRRSLARAQEPREEETVHA